MPIPMFRSREVGGMKGSGGSLPDDCLLARLKGGFGTHPPDSRRRSAAHPPGHRHFRRRIRDRGHSASGVPVAVLRNIRPHEHCVRARRISLAGHQPQLEAVLRERLTSYPDVEVHVGTSLRSFSDEGTHVTAVGHFLKLRITRLVINAWAASKSPSSRCCLPTNSANWGARSA